MTARVHERHVLRVFARSGAASSTNRAAAELRRLTRHARGFSGANRFGRFPSANFFSRSRISMFCSGLGLHPTGMWVSTGELFIGARIRCPDARLHYSNKSFDLPAPHDHRRCGANFEKARHIWWARCPPAGRPDIADSSICGE